MTATRHIPGYLLLVLLMLALAACGAANPEPAEPTIEPTAEVAEATETEVPPTSTVVPPTATVEPTEPPPPSATPTEVVEETVGALEFGDTSRGSIDEAGSENRWTLNIEEENTVFIAFETVQGDMEPVASLLDSEGFEVATSDSISEFGATLTHTVEDAGEYTLVVSALGRETGTYEVTVFNAQAGGGEIAYDETVTGVLVEDGSEDVWSFEASAGDIVDISVEAQDDALDTVIELWTPEDDSIARDDDSGDGYNPQLTGIPLLVEGTYSIRVRAFSTEGVGIYDLTLAQGEAAGGGEIAFDEPVQGELDSAPQLWTFEGEEGQQVEIALNAGEDGNLDPRLTLYGPEGDQLTSDDDSGPDYNALITDYELPTTGTYTIQITAYSGNGDFELSLRRFEPEVAGTLAYGQTVTGTLTSSAPQAWSFEGQGGEVLIITVDALTDTDTSLDPRISLVDAEGEEIAFDDDGGPGLNSAIIGFPLPAAGTYSVYVSAVSGEGGYLLNVRPADELSAGSIAYGQTVDGQLSEGQPQIWAFEAQAGDTVTIEANAAADTSLDPRISLVGPDSGEVAFDDDSGDGFNALIQSLTLDAAGTYRVIVIAYSGEGAYQLILRNE